MTVRKPIEGLLERPRQPRWIWLLAAPALAVLAFIVHIVIAGQDLPTPAHAVAPVEASTTAAPALAAASTPEAAPAAPAESASAASPPPQPTPPAEDEEEEGAAAEDPALRGPALAGQAGRRAGQVQKGESLFTALTQLKLSAGEVQPAINALSEVFDFRKARPGDRWEVAFDEAHRVTELRYQPSAEVRYVARFDKAKGKYAASRQDVPLDIRVVGLGGTVRSSLYKALADLGEKNRLISGFIDRFAWDIDFASETKPGDTFRVLVEKIYLEGRFLRYGHILAAEYTRQGKPLRVYQFTDEDGQRSWHDSAGVSVKRMFLRNPVKFARVTSGFGKRFHPILKTHKMHNGVDYAAPSGTPIQSIAAGTITFMGPKGPNGNLVTVQHTGGITAYYAHLSRFPDAKVGQKINQGDVVGYVGSTGRSTGPHLHLGIKSGGAFVDPLSIHSTRGPALSGPRLSRFKGQAKELDAKLDRIAIQPPSEGPDEPAPQGGDEAAVEEGEVDSP